MFESIASIIFNLSVVPIVPSPTRIQEFPPFVVRITVPLSPAAQATSGSTIRTQVNHEPDCEFCNVQPFCENAIKKGERNIKLFNNIDNFRFILTSSIQNGIRLTTGAKLRRCYQREQKGQTH